MTTAVGNILGSPRAEADRLLDRAFVPTSDYHALIETEDFHIVVGRRGTGKSALFQKVREHLMKQPKVYVHAETPTEHHALDLQALLEKAGCNYRTARASCRLLWRAHILSLVARWLHTHYKLKNSELEKTLQSALNRVPLASTGYDFSIKALTPLSGTAPNLLPAAIANNLGLDSLQRHTTEALVETNHRAVLLFDSLDEGWLPAELPTALLGGLALAASELADAHTGVHVVAFVRDNMFRALAHFEPDFSRHVEGSDLRLRWDEGSLFHLVAERIRAAFNVQIENDSKIWARFAQRGLEGRSGFDGCLKHTLYRPRDLLVLLNKSFIVANKAQRQQIIDTDVETAATMISVDRLEDLFKEYNSVFPGLRLFTNVLRGDRAVWVYKDLLQCIQGAIEQESYTLEDASDFAVLGSSHDVFLALYSVGFLGVQRDGVGPYVFCHDGAHSDIQKVPDVGHVAIHPCYWRAVEIPATAQPIEVLAHVYDEYETTKDPGVKDLRMQRLGQAISELPRLVPGDEHASGFEDWVLRAVKILFSGHLANVMLHPNQDAVQRRDVVATNAAKDGFWRRAYEDYGSRQVIFEVKNYADVRLEDIRQALSYSGKEYGRLVVLVYRGESEGATEKERSWLQEMYSQHGILVFLVPAKILARYLSKYRSYRRADYWDEHLGKRLDTHVRSYVNVKSSKAKVGKKQGGSLI